MNLPTIRFPLKKDRKTRAMVPATEGLSGAAGCAARMIHSAVLCRIAAAKKADAADLLTRLGDHRGANIARIEAARKRRSMRSDALWARVFAHHINDDDPRLRAISTAVNADLRASFRASIWSDRWLKVHAQKFTAGITAGRLARIDALLDRIAAHHDALTPWGHTLRRHPPSSTADPPAARAA